MSVHEPNAKTNASMPDSVHTRAPYTAQQIGDELGVKDSTIRTRWYPWIKKVAPKELLKAGSKYTELARTLFIEFSKIEHEARENWVEDARARYSHEWASVGVIEGELMPDEVGGTLAKIDLQNVDAQKHIDGEMEAVLSLIDQVGKAEDNLSKAEIEACRKKGTRKGISKFRVELQAEQEAMALLRQKLMED